MATTAETCPARTTPRRPSPDRGAALLEFAIAFVFLGVVVFSAIDMGRAFFTWNQVKNAAREGAAYAERDPWSQAPSGSGCTDPDNILYRALTESGAKRTDLTVRTERNGTPYTGCKTPATFNIDAGDTIRVEVEKPFEPLSPLAGAIFGSPMIRADVEVVVQ